MPPIYAFKIFLENNYNCILYIPRNHIYNTSCEEVDNEI